MRKSKKGFTLVELLVVIAIIGILSSVVLVSLNSARVKARDARRVSDLHQIALALENYYDAGVGTGAVGDTGLDYPTALSSLSPTYLTNVPKDPQTGADYSYNSAGCTPANQKYVIAATLENYNVALASDVDGTQCTVACGTQDTPPATAERIYCIMP